MAFNNAKNIIVGAAPVYISVKDSTDASYKENLIDDPTVTSVAFEARKSFGNGSSGTLDSTGAKTYFRNVGFTNNGLQITYNPTYEDVTVDQLLDAAKLFKSSMQVMVMTEMTEGTLQNVLTVFGQGTGTIKKDGSASTDLYPTRNEATGSSDKALELGFEAGALGVAPTERQLVAVGQAPTFALNSSGSEISATTERVYYARRVLSVQQTQFTLARNTPTTFPVTFRLLPDARYAGSEYGKIVDRVIA
jgi:hypothetical protein